MLYLLCQMRFFIPVQALLPVVWCSKSAQNILMFPIPILSSGIVKMMGLKRRKIWVVSSKLILSTGKSKWVEIEREWIELYRNRRSVDGLSATHKVNGDDEWLCEAYMKTDYTKLTEQDFQQTINDYLAYLVKEGHIYEA